MRATQLGLTMTIAGVALIAGSMFAPESPLSGAARPRTDAVRIPLPAPPSDLNPHTRGYAFEDIVADYVFDHLFERDVDRVGVYHPSLATEWAWNDDRTAMTFGLRTDVTWHDGEPFTAADVVFTFDYVMRDASRAPIKAALLAAGTTCEALGTHRVRFGFTRATFRSFALLVERGFAILPRHRLVDASADDEAAFGRAPIGTGPYRVVEWRGNRIRLARRDAPWRTPPEIDGVVFKTYASPEAAVADLKRGELDFHPRLSTNTFLDDLGQGRIARDAVRTGLERDGVVRCDPDVHDTLRLAAFAAPSVSFVAWNCRRGPTADRAVRRALAHLLDRDALARSACLGRVVTSEQSPLAPGYDPTVQPLGFSPEAALVALRKAGWFDRDRDGVLDRSGQKLALRILAPPRSRLTAVEQLRTNAKAIGVAITIDRLPPERFAAAKRSFDFDGVYLGFTLDLDEDPYPIWHSSAAVAGPGNFNLSGYARADDLLESIRHAFDDTRRAALKRELHRRLHDDQPALFIQVQARLVAWRRSLEGVVLHPRKPFGWDVREWRWAATTE